jgi:hypothetical protein
MYVTFPRLPNRAIAWAQVERDDGVVYRLFDGRAGSTLPHYARHLIVERELGIADGIWGGIAAGAEYSNMHHMRGRRPPHSAECSVDLMRKYRDRLLRAELLADLVETVAALDDPTPDEIRRLTGSMLPVLSTGIVPDPALVAAAARSLQVEAARWARLRLGEELQYEWPSGGRQVRWLPAPRQPRDGQDPPRPRYG